MSFGMLAARGARGNSSLAARRRPRCNLRGSRARVSRESSRSAAATSKRAQSEGVGLPTGARAARCATCLGTAPVAGQTRSP
eukprot:321971-Pyramimonas_sp.AAC.1